MLVKIQKFFKNHPHKKEFLVFSFLCLLCFLFFKIFPNIDLVISSWFYNFNTKTWLIDRESNWLLFHYRGLPIIGNIAFLVIFIFLLIAIFANTNTKNSKIKSIKNRKNFWLFLLCAALIGPITITETIKAFSGRTRPINTQNFNGKLLYTPPFQQANQCKKNCSFISGHVSATTFILAFAWFFKNKKRYIYFGGAFVFIISTILARIIPGGHFASDCIFGFFTTYFSLWFSELLFYLFNIQINNKNNNKN